jgi:hypothetical protein
MTNEEHDHYATLRVQNWIAALRYAADEVDKIGYDIARDMLLKHAKLFEQLLPTLPKHPENK